MEENIYRIKSETQRMEKEGAQLNVESEAQLGARRELENRARVLVKLNE